MEVFLLAVYTATLRVALVFRSMILKLIFDPDGTIILSVLLYLNKF